MLDTATIGDPALRATWTHFREVRGWDDERIATHLGVAAESVATHRPRNLRQQLLPKVQRLHDRGLGSMAIARRLGVPVATVSRCKHDLGIPVQQRRRESKPDLETRAQVRALHDAGLGLNAIAERIGISRASVYRHKKALGLVEGRNLQDVVEQAAQRRNRVAQLHDAGMTTRQIADHLEVPFATVKSDLQRFRRDTRDTRAA